MRMSMKTISKLFDYIHNRKGGETRSVFCGNLFSIDCVRKNQLTSLLFVLVIMVGILSKTFQRTEESKRLFPSLEGEQSTSWRNILNL